MNTPEQGTILWHDYETWGTNPKCDFPVQFAAIRTTLELEEIPDHVPINIMSRIPLDYLPHPQACLVTGLLPSVSLQRGMSEPEFAKRIHQQMAEPATCVAGYNSLRFDEEVTRNLLYRNLFPVYEREYKDGNSRWDVIDLLRACYALRPNGIIWPQAENGSPSFKLELLSQANNIEHANAHDALSDVRATIAMAKLVKQHQPKLYDYYWNLRNKNNVANMLMANQRKIMVYVSGYLGAAQGCCTLIMPLCQHPQNPNSWICIDLQKSFTPWTQKSADEIRQALYNKEIPSAERPGLLTIATNKCPFIAPANTLDKTRAAQLNIDIQACYDAFNIISNANIENVCKQVFAEPSPKIQTNDIDESLYTADFPSTADSKIMYEARLAVPEQLDALRGQFASEHLNALLSRYIARNYTHLLDESDARKWQQHTYDKLIEGKQSSCLTFQQYFREIDELRSVNANYPAKLNILNNLQRYGEHLSNS